MKKVLIAFLISSISFSQETIQLTPEGCLPLVTNVEGKSAKELYDLTKEWVQYYYKNPKEVLTADIDNQMIRITGFNYQFFFQEFVGKTFYDLKYTIEISFKDGKYLFTFMESEITANGRPLPLLTSTKDFYKKDGRVRGSYRMSVESFNASVNKIYLSNYNYITGKTNSEKNNW